MSLRNLSDLYHKYIPSLARDMIPSTLTSIYLALAVPARRALRNSTNSVCRSGNSGTSWIDSLETPLIPANSEARCFSSSSVS